MQIINQTKEELIEDVISKNLQSKVMAEFVWNEYHKCIDLNGAVKIMLNDKSICCQHKTQKWSKCPNNKNSLNYAGSKGKKKRLEENMGENMNKSNKGGKSPNKLKKGEEYTAKQKQDQASSPERQKVITIECNLIKVMTESIDQLNGNEG